MQTRIQWWDEDTVLLVIGKLSSVCILPTYAFILSFRHLSTPCFVLDTKVIFLQVFIYLRTKSLKQRCLEKNRAS